MKINKDYVWLTTWECFGLRGDLNSFSQNYKKPIKDNVWLWGCSFYKFITTKAKETFGYGGLICHIKRHETDHK